MTNEEAIKELKIVREDYWDEYGDPMPALDMAIKALEQQPCEDTISRQAAIDALDKRFDSIPMEQTTEILLLRKDLRNLPSAEPERKKGNEKCSNKLPCGWCSLFDTPCFGRGGKQDE